MKRFSLKTEKKVGSTLIEMLVYLAILLVLLAAMINMTLIVSRTYRSLKVSKNIEAAAGVAFERMTREIRGAISINTANSIFDTNPGVLVLNTTDPSSGAAMTVKFYVRDGKLQIDEQGINIGALTPLNTTITNLVFRHIPVSKSVGVKIEVTIQSSLAEVSAAGNFYDTAELRRSF